MRVIAGRLGGRQLLAPKGWQVRPTSERVREALYSALGDVSGFAVADLYCGTGALGIEAISRGAASAVLVDSDTRPALGNVHNLGLTGEIDLVRAEVPAWLTAESGARKFDLVLLDPPYRMAADLATVLDRELPRILAPGGRVVIECAAKHPLELPSLEIIRERRYGRTMVTFLEDSQAKK